jgi:PAS domain S-box-containing protein
LTRIEGEPADLELVERLRRQEQLLREAGELAHVGGWEFDPATGEGAWTAEIARIHDLDPEDPTSVGIGLSYFHGESRRRIEAAVAAAVTHGTPYDLELELVTPAGRRKWVRTIGRPEVVDGRVVRVRGSMQEITERVLAARRLELRDAVSRVLAEAPSLAEATPRLLEAIALAEGWEYGALWQVDPVRRRLISSGAWAAPGVPSAALIERTRSLAIERGQGMPGRIWESGLPVRCDLRLDRDYLRREEALDAGLVTAVGIPLVARGAVVGVLDFLAATDREIDPALLDTLRAVGEQVGQFLDRRRAIEALERYVAASPSVIYALEVVPGGGLRPAWRGGALERLTGWTEAEALDRTWWLENVHPDDRAKVPLSDPFEGPGDSQVSEYRFRRKDGGWIWIRDEERLLRDAGGDPTEIVGSWTDVTARVELEAKLRQAYKLEAIGRLAGGVAHDFNNLLTIVCGNAELLERQVPADGRAAQLVDEILQTVDRGAALTRQLLTFSRSQELAPEPLDLAALVVRSAAMLRRLIGEDVEIEIASAGDPLPVRADRSQLDQVLLNLVVNARDAMPKGGRLTIELAEAELGGRAVAAAPGVAPGRFVRLTVADTGHGMTPEVRARIFEPFFTTKPPGRGTGLGLATVFGVVRQSGGLIEVETAPGGGTRFDLFFPWADLEPSILSASPPPAEPSESKPGHETILLVEDEAGLRRLAERALSALGYRVLAAGSGEEALRAAAEHHGAIHLLLTDLVMPGMGGAELAAALRPLRNGLRVLFMSGYAEGTALPGDDNGNPPQIHLVKPFALSQLGQVVRRALDAPPSPGPADAG